MKSQAKGLTLVIYLGLILILLLMFVGMANAKDKQIPSIAPVTTRK